MNNLTQTRVSVLNNFLYRPRIFLLYEILSVPPKYIEFVVLN